MDQLIANETGNNRKSLVISRLELFEQINSTGRPNIVNKPVSRSNSNNISDVDSRGRPDVNNTVNRDDDSCDDGIDANAAVDRDGGDMNANRSPVTEEADEYFRKQDLLPDLKCLQMRDDLSPCSKRISYNLAVSRGAEFNKIAINRHKDKPKCDSTIDESEPEEAVVATTEIPLSRKATADVIDESDSEQTRVKVEKIDAQVDNDNTDANDSTTLLVSRTEGDAGSSIENLSRCVPVDDINIEDLNSTKLTNDILSAISSSRIANECKFDETDTNNTSCTDHATPLKSTDVDYPEELNPFGDDDETENFVDSSKDNKTCNPFDSEDSETDLSTSKSSAKVSTNPFWSGSEEEDEPSLDDVSVKKTPVPLPRSVRKPVVSITPQPSAKPRIKSTINDECGSPNSANVPPSPSPSRRSLQTPKYGGRKLSNDSLDVSFLQSSGSQSGNSTLRKKRPPPPPPPVAAKSLNINNNNNITSNGPQVKEQTNQTRAMPAKPVHSPWKNKKGPAPARPIPIRRPVKEMPLEDIKTELSDIEVRQQELERQGKHLEQMIHDQNAVNSDNAEDSSSNEELVLQLFELVNEKNELLRRQSELMYMRKMHNLEKEHADIEYQLRCLMLQPESNKTDCDKSQEEELLRRLLEVVEKRNEIIEAMEKDRLRETAEDKSVTTQLDVNECSKEDKSSSKKSKKKKDKVKERKEDHDNKLSPSKVIKQKFMTLRHSTKKLNSKIPH